MEALLSRSPLIVSDHPMFSVHLRDGYNCLTFKASDPDSLVGALARLRSDALTYRRLSDDAPRFLQETEVPLTLYRLIELFLSGEPDSTSTILRYRVSGPHFRTYTASARFQPTPQAKLVRKVSSTLGSMDDRLLGLTRARS
ncbi:MAG: glycosyltransferase [Myxococcales bacterium]|nr:glycosyltransferase [Myxococcales bacterium]